MVASAPPRWSGIVFAFIGLTTDLFCLPNINFMKHPGLAEAFIFPYSLPFLHEVNSLISVAVSLLKDLLYVLWIKIREGGRHLWREAKYKVHWGKLTSFIFAKVLLKEPLLKNVMHVLFFSFAPCSPCGWKTKYHDSFFWRESLILSLISLLEQVQLLVFQLCSVPSHTGFVLPTQTGSVSTPMAVIMTKSRV